MKNILAVLCALLFVVSCDLNYNKPGSADDPIKLAGRTMGTTYSVTLYPGRRNVDNSGVDSDGLPSPHELLLEESFSSEKSTDDSRGAQKENGLDPALLKRLMDDRLAEINALMSTYIEDSELSQLNNNNQLGKCITLSRPLYDVLKQAKDIGVQSLHYFDVTVGPAVDAWGFGPKEIVSIPTEEQIIQLQGEVGDDVLQLREEGRCLIKREIRRIDLSAIAKGYAVDQLVSILRAEGLQNFLVEIGGEIWAEGDKPGNKPWTIAVEAPIKGAGRMVQRAIELKDVAIASSGDYRNYYEKEGQVYSHTIDPHTAKPVEHHLVSVTVLADSTAKADAWATAFLAMGTEQALSIADKLKLPVLLIERYGDDELKEYQSGAMSHYIEVR